MLSTLASIGHWNLFAFVMWECLSSNSAIKLSPMIHSGFVY